MSHSVEGHLKLNVGDYDRLIRQLVPGYAAMREAHMALLRKLLPADRPCRVLDLGGGTGALAEAVAATLPQAEVEIWDIDRWASSWLICPLAAWAVIDIVRRVAVSDPPHPSNSSSTLRIGRSSICRADVL